MKKKFEVIKSAQEFLGGGYLCRVLALLIIPLLLISCNNFLKGAETAKEIENAVAYANAPSYTISIDYPSGKGVMKSPAGGEVQKKKTDKFVLHFEPSTDSEFVNWIILDSVSGQEFQNGEYLTLDSLYDEETVCTFTKEPPAGVKLTLKATIASRPQIISNLPQILGVLKDTSIQVLFDHDMDPYSIYYDEDEVKNITAQVGEENLLVSELNKGKVYGYKKAGETFFKNILFEDNDSLENITGCFDEPFFATPRMLSINTSKTNKLADFTPVLVTLEKEFFYKVDEANPQAKKITMSQSKKWVYQVNDSEDEIKPRIVEDKDVKVFINSGENLAEQKAIIADSTVPAVPSSTEYDFNRDKKIKVNLKVTDLESGPTINFGLSLTKVKDANYDTISNAAAQTKYVNFQRVTSQNGIYNSEIDLASLFGGELSDGVYQMNFEFSDRSGKSITYPENKCYYFTVDNTISMADPVFADTSDSSAIKMKFSWTKCADFAKTEIRYKKKADSTWINSEVFTDQTTKEYTSLELATDYDFEITNYDFAGNKQVFNLSKTSADWTEFSVSGTPDRTVYLSGESFDGAGLTATATLSNGNSWAVSNYTSDLGTDICIMGKAVTLSYTYSGKTKSVKIPQVYYIAASDALTQKPLKLTNYSGKGGTSGTYYKFGDFPQRIAANQDESYYTAETIYNNWYLGSDGYFYEKCNADIYTSTDWNPDLTCSDGTVLTNKTDYYFKVEPIIWRVLTSNYNNSNKYLLLSENALTGNIKYYDTYTYVNPTRRTINNESVELNNYMYSQIRAYLNGKYENGDTQDKKYTDNGFLQNAFTTSAQNLIADTTVDNSQRSTNPDNNANYFNNGVNSFYCDNTNDKIFLLSMQEVTKSDYGFNQDVTALDSSRVYPVTDYAKAHYTLQSTGKGCRWYLRSPYWKPNTYRYSEYGDSVWAPWIDGHANSSSSCYSYTGGKDYNGIVPALCIAPENLQ